MTGQILPQRPSVPTASSPAIDLSQICSVGEVNFIVWYFLIICIEQWVHFLCWSHLGKPLCIQIQVSRIDNRVDHYVKGAYCWQTCRLLADLHIVDGLSCCWQTCLLLVDMHIFDRPSCSFGTCTVSAIFILLAGLHVVGGLEYC